MRLLCFLGRERELAKKEIEAAATILSLPWTSSMVQGEILELKLSLPFNEAGFCIADFQSGEFQEILQKINVFQNTLGTISKMAIVFGEVSATEVMPKLRELVAQTAVIPGKWNVGVSLYGKGLDMRRIGYDIKQVAHSVRYVSAQSGPTLNTAQVFHNRLSLAQNKRGLEIVVVQKNHSWLIGCTATVQNINSYAERDFKIPAPDPVSGMLPPKLAQAIINLSLKGVDRHGDILLYDPFCGNGRILLEATLMNISAAGSDVAAGKVQAASTNLHWLEQHYTTETHPHVWQMDATDPKNVTQLEQYAANRAVYIAAEPYLGPPLRQPLAVEQKQKWLDDVLPVYSGFFQAWNKAAVQGMIVVFPKVRMSRGNELSLYQILVDRLDQLGYSSSVLTTYARPDSIVAREIVKISLVT